MRVAAWLLLLLNARATTIWPAPAHMHAGNGIVAVSSDAEWRLSHPRCETLRAGVERYRALIFARGPRPVARGVRRIEVHVANASEAYPADWSAVDESYELSHAEAGACLLYTSPSPRD